MEREGSGAMGQRIVCRTLWRQLPGEFSPICIPTVRLGTGCVHGVVSCRWGQRPEGARQRRGGDPKRSGGWLRLARFRNACTEAASLGGAKREKVPLVLVLDGDGWMW